MCVSSSSALGIKTCLYKGFLTAEGTKCSLERKEPESLHLPSTPALERNNASQRSWQPALGRWQKQHYSLHKRRKPKLSALGSGVSILPTTSWKRRDRHSNQPSWASGNHRFSPQQFPLLLLFHRAGRYTAPDLVPSAPCSFWMYLLTSCQCACRDCPRARRAEAEWQEREGWKVKAYKKRGCDVQPPLWRPGEELG